MTFQSRSAGTRALCELAPIIPVLVVHDVAHAVPLAEALVRGGLPVLEVTLRTPAALDVIAAMATVKGGHVGAGTLITPADVAAAKVAGATFGVSPGATDAARKGRSEHGRRKWSHCTCVRMQPRIQRGLCALEITFRR